MGKDDRLSERIVGHVAFGERQQIEIEAANMGLSPSAFARVAMLEKCAARGNVFISSSYLVEKNIININTSGVRHESKPRFTPEHVALAEWFLGKMRRWGQDRGEAGYASAQATISYLEAPAIARGLALSECSLDDLKAALVFCLTDKYAWAHWGCVFQDMRKLVSGNCFREMVANYVRRNSEGVAEAKRPEVTDEERASFAAEAEAQGQREARWRAEQDAALRAAGHDPAVLSAKRRAELYLELRTGRAQDFTERVSLPVDALCSPTKGAA